MQSAPKGFRESGGLPRALPRALQASTNDALGATPPEACGANVPVRPDVLNHARPSLNHEPSSREGCRLRTGTRWVSSNVGAGSPLPRRRVGGKSSLSSLSALRGRARAFTRLGDCHFANDGACPRAKQTPAPPGGLRRKCLRAKTVEGETPPRCLPRATFRCVSDVRGPGVASPSPPAPGPNGSPRELSPGTRSSVLNRGPGKGDGSDEIPPPLRFGEAVPRDEHGRPRTPVFPSSAGPATKPAVDDPGPCPGARVEFGTNAALVTR